MTVPPPIHAHTHTPCTHTASCAHTHTCTTLHTHRHPSAHTPQAHTPHAQKHSPAPCMHPPHSHAHTTSHAQPPCTPLPRTRIPTRMYTHTRPLHPHSHTGSHAPPCTPLHAPPPHPQASPLQPPLQPAPLCARPAMAGSRRASGGGSRATSPISWPAGAALHRACRNGGGRAVSPSPTTPLHTHAFWASDSGLCGRPALALCWRGGTNGLRHREVSQIRSPSHTLTDGWGWERGRAVGSGCRAELCPSVNPTCTHSG